MSEETLAKCILIGLFLLGILAFCVIVPFPINLIVLVSAILILLIF